MNKRSMYLEEIKLQNVVYCLFVVAIHLFTAEILQIPIFFFIQRFLFVAIFGFIFLSGMKQFLHINDKNIFTYYKTRFKKVFLPYIIAVVVYWIVYKLFNCTEVSFIELPFNILFGNLASHFYFIIAISQLYILTPLLNVIIQKYNKKLILCVSFFMTIITALFFCKYSVYNRLFSRYIFCYVCGCYAGRYYDNFLNKILKYKRYIYATFIATLVIELSEAYLLRLGLVSLVAQQIITTLYMPIAILFIYSVSFMLSKKFPAQNTKLINIIDRNSYLIYLYHTLPIFFADRILEWIGIPNIFYYELFRVFITITLLTLMILLWHYIKNGKEFIKK